MSKLSEITEAKRLQAAGVAGNLVATLARADLVLPSAAVDWPSMLTGEVLVELGRARSDVVLAIADLITDGLNARDRQQS